MGAPGRGPPALVQWSPLVGVVLQTQHRCLGRFHFDGVRKGLHAWLFRDLWDLRGSSALIQFIPLTAKSLETISRYRVSRFCSSSPSACPSLWSPSTSSRVYSSYEHHDLVL